MTETKYFLGQEVILSLSKEAGTIIGVAKYINNQEHQYLIRYVAADGRQDESRRAESAIEIRQ